MEQELRREDQISRARVIKASRSKKFCLVCSRHQLTFTWRKAILAKRASSTSRHTSNEKRRGMKMQLKKLHFQKTVRVNTLSAMQRGSSDCLVNCKNNPFFKKWAQSFLWFSPSAGASDFGSAGNRANVKSRRDDPMEKGRGEESEKYPIQRCQNFLRHLNKHFEWLRCVAARVWKLYIKPPSILTIPPKNIQKNRMQSSPNIGERSF